MCNVLEEDFIELFFVLQTGKFVVGVGEVAVEKVKFFKLKRLQAAFPLWCKCMLSSGNNKTLTHGHWRFYGEHRGTAVAGALRRIPKLGVAGKIKLHLLARRVAYLNFLQTQDIRLLSLQKINKALIHRRADAVDVP